MALGEGVLTIEDFAAYVADNPDKRLELIDGRISEKVTSERHGKIAGWLIHLLIVFLQQNPTIKGHWSMEASHAPPGDRYNQRRPDVSFRVTDEAASDASSLEGMPDFCVEIKSASNSYDELREKAAFYLQHGAHLVWLIYPEPKLVEVYDAAGSAVYKAGQTLSGGDVLPGFTVTVDEVFSV